jgi:hypothetical protein
MTRTDLELYTKSDVENARTKGQLVGWVQGGAVVLAGALLLSFIGWIPTLVVLGAGGVLIYKLMSSPKRD